MNEKEKEFEDLDKNEDLSHLDDLLNNNVNDIEKIIKANHIRLTKAQKDSLTIEEKRIRAMNIQIEFKINGDQLDKNMFELRDTMRFDVDINSKFCDSNIKTQNQEKYKKFISDLHHKGLTDKDWEFLSQRTIDYLRHENIQEIEEICNADDTLIVCNENDTVDIINNYMIQKLDGEKYE